MLCSGGLREIKNLLFFDRCVKTPFLSFQLSFVEKHRGDLVCDLIPGLVHTEMSSEASLILLFLFLFLIVRMIPY